MKEKKWTPGPWRYSEAHGDIISMANVKPDVICDAKEGRYNVLPSKHNAHLIAAAPDLVEALASLQAWVTDGGFEDTHEGVAEICGQARAALAKSYGETR